MKIVSFNIRCDCEPETPNGFQHRRPYIREKILKEKPDIIGFQEVLPHVARWLEEALPEYIILSCGRGADYEDEAMTIAFKKGSLRLLEYHTFWLSDTPEVPGSRFEEQSMCPRTCSVATFKVEKTGEYINFYNTHLDHISEKARILGIEKVINAVKESKYPAVLVGDLNAFPDSGVIRAVEGSGLGLTDVTPDVGPTFHDYGRDEEKIDYIYIGKEFACKGAGKWEDCHNGVYLSDHYPVWAEIERK